MTAFAWSIGWRGASLALLGLTILLGQLSVGWSNDAFDARIDAVAGRETKPTVSGLISARKLWIAAAVAVCASAAMSWLVAGWVGGSFHVFALIMAWLYNTVLSRTMWSWVPYALAFGAMPAFMTYGLGVGAPPVWTVVVFAVVGVAAHLANAVPDLETDAAAGLGGLAVGLGRRNALIACWVLLAVGTVILVVVISGEQPVLARLVALAYLLAGIGSVVSTGRSAPFRALIVVVAVDVGALIVAGSLAG